MKRIKVVQIIGFVLFLIYITLAISDLIIGYIGDYRELVFSILLAVISINMLTKGVFLKSQSTLWFAITLVLYAILVIIFNTINVKYNTFNYIFILLPIIASVINIVVFHNLMYIKVIILNITIAIPFILSKYLKLNNIWLFIIGIVSIFIGIILCRFFKMKGEKV